MQPVGVEYMPFVMAGERRVIYGGRYMARPAGTFGVKMAAEIAAPSDVSIPTRDYSVPDVAALLAGVKATIRHMMLGDGRDVYAGCMGGIGRTGLFLAAVAKVAGYRDPVGYVRMTYKAHAVETPQQMAYIAALDVRGVRWLVRWWTVRRAVRQMRRWWGS